MSVSNLISLLETAEEYIGQHSFREVKILGYLFASKDTVVCNQSIIKDLKLSKVAVSRSLKLLSERGMVTLLMNTENRRRKSVSLTDKGNKFKVEVIKIMGGKS